MSGRNKSYFTLLPSELRNHVGSIILKSALKMREAALAALAASDAAQATKQSTRWTPEFGGPFDELIFSQQLEVRRQRQMLQFMHIQVDLAEWQLLAMLLNSLTVDFWDRLLGGQGYYPK